MCGIVGFSGGEGGGHNVDLLHRMLELIAYRGPDAFGGFQDDISALGSARLSIVDMAGGTQPAVSPQRDVAVVFNGEIFNYKEIRSDLMRRGVNFKTNSEVETLLYLYLDRGEAMFAQLEGQFAIAIWDRRSRTLILGRDRVGIRPLFWARDHGRLVFASEIKALSVGCKSGLELDPAALMQTARFWTTVGETSAFRGVHQIPPGHYLVAGMQGERLHRYWSWPFPHQVEPLLLRNEAEYLEAFHSEMRAAVERQRMSDVPVGSYLSGGVDSSVIAACLRQSVGDSKLCTYSVTFSDSEYDESEAQLRMALHLGVKHTSVHVESSDIANNFPEVVWHAETPLFRTAPVPLFLLSKRVNEDGIKVVMTGEGADEVLLGYDLFRETLVRRFWGRHPSSAWRGQLFRRLYHYLPQFRNRRYAAMMLDFYRPFLEDQNDPHFAMAVRWANGRALESYFSEDLIASAEGQDPVKELERWLPAGYGDANDVAKAQAIEMSTLLGNYLLSSQGDRMSMAHSVEGRYPYLDDRFLAFCARLPQRLKLKGLKDKFIMRQAFAGTIPDEVRLRPKVAYQAPEMRSFFTGGVAADYVDELLSPERLRAAGLFNPERVAQLVAKGRANSALRLGMRDNMAFVLMLSTMLLDDMFIRRRPSQRSLPTSRNPLVMVN